MGMLLQEMFLQPINMEEKSADTNATSPSAAAWDAHKVLAASNNFVVQHPWTIAYMSSLYRIC